MEKNVDLLNLFKEKKYSELIYIIEYELSESQKNLSVINLLGVSRLLQKERTTKDIALAIENFKTVYLKEKKPEISSQAFRNFVNASADLYDLEKKSLNIEKAFDYVRRSDGLERTKDLAIQYSNMAVEAALKLEKSPSRDAMIRLARKVVEQV